MTHYYRCPNCKTNRSRFNIIEQIARPIKVDPHTGEVTSDYTSEQIENYHVVYNGPQYRIQCGVCGNIGNEETYIQFAKFQSS